MTRRVRNLFIVGLAALAAVLLGACQAKAGAAAIVDGKRITEKTVNSYVLTTDPSKIDGARSDVLSILVQERLLRVELHKHGGVPSAGGLDAQHDAGLPLQIKQVGLTGTDADTVILQQFANEGIAAKFLPRFLQVFEMNHVYSLRGLDVAAISKLKVSVSPRYGRWDRSELAVESGTTRPSFLLPVPSSGGTSAS